MHEYTPEAAQSIESDSRQFTHRLMIDWNNNGQYNHPLSDMSQYVTRSSREQAISSTAPEELMLIEGHGSASLELEVAGKFRNVPLTGHFAPYNGRSIFYAEGLSLGVSMYYDIAVWTDKGWEWYRQFTGTVKEVESIREQGSVRLYCLDNVERLRTGASVHAYGVPLSYLNAGRKRGALVDSSSIIDLAARSGGFTMGPKPGFLEDQYSAVILSAPLHGSILPEIGQLDEAQTFHRTEAWETGTTTPPNRAEAYTTGPHGYLALNGVPTGQEAYGTKKFWITEETSTATIATMNGTFTLGAWIYWGGSGTIGSDCRLITLKLQTNEYRLVVRADGYVGGQVYRDNGNSTWDTQNTEWLPIPSAVGWHYIEARFNWENFYGNIQGRARIDSSYTSVKTLINGNLLFFNETLSGLVTVNNWLPVSDVEIWRSFYGRDTFNNRQKNITPAGTAVVDWGRNRLMYTLRETDNAAWDLAKDVAAAEYGVVWFDEYGKFRFQNFNTVQQAQSATHRYFDISDVEGLAMRTTMDSVRNKWVVTTNTGYSTEGVFYELKANEEPWATLDNSGFPATNAELWKLPFNPKGGNVFSFYYIKAAPNLMCPHPWSITSLGVNDAWDQNTPIHGKKVYHGINYAPGAFPTEQKWIRRDLVRMSILNTDSTDIGFWIVEKNDGRFRMKATLVYEDEPETWTISTTDVANLPGNDPGSLYGKSIGRYGERVIELGDNFWLQDEFQTRRMLQAIIKKFGRPIPVTDAITVPGDPRVQIGDILEISDRDGMGANIRVQVYGITRNLEDGSGLTDTYQVEVVENPGIGRWDDDVYGLWDTSLIWS